MTDTALNETNERQESLLEEVEVWLKHIETGIVGLFKSHGVDTDGVAVTTITHHEGATCAPSDQFVEVNADGSDKGTQTIAAVDGPANEPDTPAVAINAPGTGDIALQPEADPAT